MDVRIVAPAHRDLPAMVADGRFREDLWYRLAVFPMRIPPLRERQDDIADLAGHFARRAAARHQPPYPASTHAQARRERRPAPAKGRVNGPFSQSENVGCRHRCGVFRLPRGALLRV